MSSRVKMIALVVVLLAGVAAFNYAFRTDPTQLAAQGVGHSAHEHEDEEEPPPSTPPMTVKEAVQPLGPADAPVKVEMLYSQSASLTGDFRPLGEALAKDYAPEVRVEFVDTSTSKGNARAHEVSQGITSGVAVNGSVVKRCPNGPGYDLITFMGAPGQAWNSGMLRGALDYELQKKGIKVPAAAKRAEEAEPAPSA